MIRHFIRPKTKHGRFLYISLISYLVVGVSGCANRPRTEKPPTSVSRAMETRSFPGDLKTVLKASINSLQDMDYTIAVLNSDIGLITANRTTEQKKAALTDDKPNQTMSDGQKACLAIGAIALIAILISSIFSDDDDDKKNRGRGSSRPVILGDRGRDDGPPCRRKV